ncbi:MAG: cytochrome b561 [Gammaproteobacteria bacterium]|nr:MAG: cytochrome b561 [Gammaproteobacteria bacterium]TND01454.1 MAG: cytochrome b561 [Gammaproteobacteria bacterium]
MERDERVKVWDIGVRVFHWSLVVLFFVAYFTGEDDSLVHIYAGYAIIGLLVFRIVWGFIGTKHARFSDFIYGRAAVLGYASSLIRRRPIHYAGHNPVGGLMVILLLVLLVGISWSGLEVYGAQGHGPLAGNSLTMISTAVADDDHEGSGKDSPAEKFWEEIHEAFSNVTLFFVLIHFSGVIVTSLVHRENLIRAMITGYKQKR